MNKEWLLPEVTRAQKGAMETLEQVELSLWDAVLQGWNTVGRATGSAMFIISSQHGNQSISS